MLTSSLVLTISAITFLINDIITLKHTISSNLSTMARVIGNNSTAAIVFEDRMAAAEILSSLSAEPHVISAFLYNSNGEAIARYFNRNSKKTNRLEREMIYKREYWKNHGLLPKNWHEGAPQYKNLKEGITIRSDHIDVFQRIYLDNKVIGAICIEYDLEPLKSRLKWYVAIGTSVLIISLIMAYFIASRLQRFISGPIIEVTEKMKTISKERDYALRVKKDRFDELGSLIDSFNEMLAQIQMRDKELEQHREHLEELVQIRTEELRQATEKALAMAKQAQSASLAKSAFLANMSHELRTPLNAIIGFSEVLLSKHFGELNDTQQEYLDDILSSARHLLALIQDILDLSKIEAGKMELVLSYANTKELIQKSIAMIREKILKHGIKVTTETSNIPETMKIDERKIKQVLFNLLTNAAKFTPDGGRIHLEESVVSRTWVEENIPETFRDEVLSSLDSDHTEYLRIAVSDTGIGIKKESLKRIFEPFQQEDNSTSRKYGGTGLGLALSKEIIILHKGGIWVESNPGKGSTFTFVLPIVE